MHFYQTCSCWANIRTVVRFSWRVLQKLNDLYGPTLYFGSYFYSSGFAPWKYRLCRYEEERNCRLLFFSFFLVYMTNSNVKGWFRYIETKFCFYQSSFTYIFLEIVKNDCSKSFDISLQQSINHFTFCLASFVL